jgi:general secretion pathway protein D
MRIASLVTAPARGLLMTGSASRLTRRLATGLLAVMLTGCASGSLERAKNADELHDYDIAVAEYAKAVREHPQSQAAQLGLETAKLRAAQAHLVQGQRLASQGRIDDAILELQIAADLNPTNEEAARALRAARTAQRDRLTKEAEGSPTALEQLLAKQRTLVVPGFTLPETMVGEGIQTGLNSTAREVYLTLGKLVNLSITFDPTFQDRQAPVSLLANTMTVREALNAIARATNTFYQVTGPNTIIVVPNTPVKQIEYQQQVVQNFYVQNTDPAKLTDFLRTVADVRFQGTTAGVNAISVRDTPDRVAMVGRLIAAIDKAPPEVVVDVEILEVDRDRLQEYGLQLASSSGGTQSAGPNGSVSVQSDPSTIAALQALGPANVIATGIPALYYRLLKTDANTRTLANPHVRMTDGVQGVAEFGESVPVPNTTFAPVQQGGQVEQAVTSFTYQNVGVSIKITTRTHANDDVSLVLDVLLNNQSGTGFQGLPVFGNRHVSTTIRLKDGETNILAGLIRNDETIERDGMPGISSIPGLGSLFSKNHKERQQTDVVVMLTPHILHGLALSEDDLRPLMVPNDGTGLGPGPSLNPVGAPGVGRGGGPPAMPAGSAPDSGDRSPAPAAAAPAAPITPAALTLTPALPVTPGWPSGLRTVALSKSPTPTTTPR